VWWLCVLNTYGGQQLISEVSVSVRLGWAHKATHALRPFSALLCVPICFIPPVVPYLWHILTQWNLNEVAWFHKYVYLGDEIWIPLKPSPFVPVDFLWSILLLQDQSPPAEPMPVEGIHRTMCYPVPRSDRMWHCYRHLSATQPWLWWAIVLLAVLVRHPLHDKDT
jgi:hypothetical protein